MRWLRLGRGCRWALAICALAILAASPGCQCVKQMAGGAKTAQQKKKEDEDKKKREKEKLANFELSQPQLEPTDDQQLQVYTKPGHWVSATVMARANNFDFSADFANATTDNSRQTKISEGTRFKVSSSRPAALPKGQPKRFESTWFIPPGGTVFLDYRLLGRAGNEVLGSSRPASAMPAHQFYLVVLADNPDRYAYLSLLDVTEAPVANSFSDEQLRANYLRIVRPRIDNRLPLPSHPLCWTMISGIWWDNINPNLFSPDQQDALLDWLHWGGNLVISGPDSLEKLQGGFLDPFLPADPTGASELGPDAFKPLNEYWSLSPPGGARQDLEVLVNEPLVGVRLEPRVAGREATGTGQLVYERQVGNGRIVVTAFSLKQRQVINWGSFDSFVNGCLMRRPARRYGTTALEAGGEVFASWTDGYDMRDPRLISGLRLFSRDVDGATEGSSQSPSPLHYQKDWRMRGYAASNLGVAGWSNRNAASRAGREILEEAAGIRIPKADFVVSVLAAYLFVLVPVNWAFFRLIGRVEWAWVAAPLIAVVGSIAVVKLAQLDIGFARSRTEAAILELHDGHRRGHLTRFTALYSSLTTAHSLEFDDAGALSLPFPSDPDRHYPLHESTYTAVIQRAGVATLSGFTVNSNSTERARSEQILTLEGPVSLEGDDSRGWSLRNGSQLTLKDAVVLHRNEQGKVLVARLGDVQHKTSRAVALEAAPVELEAAGLEGLWDDVEGFQRQTPAGSMSLRRWLRLAADNLYLLPGEFRLIAWSDQAMSELTISPTVSQSIARTLILAHLRPLTLPPCLPDKNLRRQFREFEAPLREGDFMTPIERNEL